MADNKKYKIVLAEDHRIVREGLRALLDPRPSCEIVGEAENGLEAIRCVEKTNPDIIIIDLSMPKMRGLDAIAEIKSRSPETKILVLTVHKAEEYVHEALRAGAHGYLLKDATAVELKMAIEQVLEGNYYMSSALTGKLVEAYLNGKPYVPSETSWESLTSREKQILKMIAEGYKNKQIADELCISIKTVEKHRSNLMKKLDLHSSSEITAFALERGLITTE
jgi:DNA-binding NarL/FixJ family response regulator